MSQLDRLHIIIPFLPPSSNKIYVTDWKRKRRFKSNQAQAFRNRFLWEVVPNYLPQISQLVVPKEDPTVLYVVSVHFYFPRDEIINKTWGEGKKTSAKTRYKKMDTGNRLKLLLDCLSDSIGIDDSYFSDISGSKRIAESYHLDPQVHIFLARIDPSQIGA